MKKLITLGFLLLASRCFGADGVEVFRAGLAAFQANGPDALLQTWYGTDEQEKKDHLRNKLISMTKNLGNVVDTQVFAPKDLGRHIQRLYGVIYFRKRPLWVRAEFYSIDGQSGFISLEFSPSADDILPLEIGVAKR